MSSSVTHSGTTIRSGRSGRFLGMAAAGLAVAIAIGIVIGVNQGTETVVSGAQSETASGEFSWQARTEYMQEQYATALAESSPTFSVIGGAANQVPEAARVSPSSPTFSVIGGAANQVPEAARVSPELAQQLAIHAQNIADQQLEAYLKLHAQQATLDGSDARFQGLEELLTRPNALDGSDVRFRGLEGTLVRPTTLDGSDARFQGLEDMLSSQDQQASRAMRDQRWDEMNETGNGNDTRPINGRY